MKNQISRLCISLLTLILLTLSAAAAEVVTLPMDFSGGMPYDAKFELTTMTYEDPSISVERGRIENKDTKYNATIWWAKIKIANASQLRTASVNGFNRGACVKAVVLAKRVNAVVAINGDYFSQRPESYVLRQGELFRDNVGAKLDVLLIDEDGDLHVILAKDDPVHTDKTQVNGKKVVNAFTFGPALIINDEVVLDEHSAPSMSAPESRGERMCLIQTAPLEYMVVTCRGRGATAQEMVTMVQELVGGHIEVAYLMDGGQSAQMVFLGKLLNKTDRNAREVPDIIYFASAYTED